MRLNKFDKAPIALVLAVLSGCGGGDVRSARTTAEEAPAPEPAPGFDAGGKPLTPQGDGPTTAATDPAGASEPVVREQAPDEHVAEDRRVGALSPAELERLCRDGHEQVIRALAAQAEVQCTANAIAFSNTPEECTAARRACLQQESAVIDETCEVDAPALAEDCADVSVADVRACSAAWASRLEAAARQLDCSAAGRAPAEPDLADPEECQNIDARCAH